MLANNFVNSTKIRHIEWAENLGMVVAQRLTRPLFSGCIEMFYSEPVEVQSRNLVCTDDQMFGCTSRHRATVKLEWRGTRCDVFVVG